MGRGPAVSTRTLCVAIAAFLAAIAICSVAAAQTPDETPEEAEARLHFEDGRLAFAEGRNEIALSEFTAAYEISQRPELLYNIGLVEDRLRHDRDALDAFERYLEALPDAENRASVESRIRVLQQAIAQQQALEMQASQFPDTPPTQQEGDPWASPALWVMLGLVVVAVGVGIGVVVGLSQDPGTAPVMPGPSGVVVQTLSVSF